MLSTSAIKNLDYYSKLAVEDYYLSGGEPAGIWAGLGAMFLGLKYQVDNNEFRHIFRGFSPTGKPLCEKPGESHRAGWDFTFSAPKSVSVIWASSNPTIQKKIQSAQLQAVKLALKFLEHHAAVTRRGHGGHTQEPVIGLIAALFEHSTSRAQDPQLHTHCLIANLAPRTDTSWGTIESRKLYLWQKAAGAIYRSSLAAHLRELGLEIERQDGKDNFELAGIPNIICQHFSKRATSIDAALDHANVASSASKIGDRISLSTRTYKKPINRPLLMAQWQSELDDLGLNNEVSQGLFLTCPDTNCGVLPVSSILEKVVETRSIFRLQDLYTAIAVEAQWQYVDVQEIEHTVTHFIEQHDVISLGNDIAGNQLFSTPAMIALEREMTVLADKLQKHTRYKLSEDQISSAINKQEKSHGFSLSEEQKEGVYSVCQSGLDILQGAAGAGKSTSMRAVRIAYQTAGYRVIGATIARQASLQLSRETGISSRTIASLVSAIESNRLRLENTVILIDEAGQLPIPDLIKILSAAHNANCKVILVGEQHQLDAITHGGSLRYLSERQGCSRIEKIRRQREQWAREAVMQLRGGEASKALSTYQERGFIHFANNSTEAQALLVNEWIAYREKNPDKESLIIAQRWKDVISLNKQVRNYYQTIGTIENQNIPINCVVSNQATMLLFSKGERVRFTRNDYRLGLTNGETGILKKIEKINDDINLHIKRDDGQEFTFSASSYCDENGNLFLSHAYSSTIYASQGRTINGDVFIYYTTSMDKPASYVAGSRHKDNCHWVANREEIDIVSGTRDISSIVDDNTRLSVMAEKMSITRDKYLAVEYLDSEFDSRENQHSLELIDNYTKTDIFEFER